MADLAVAGVEGQQLQGVLQVAQVGAPLSLAAAALLQPALGPHLAVGHLKSIQSPHRPATPHIILVCVIA
jgi:hypothetical protein